MIEVHIANNERLQRLQLRYTVGGKRQCREIRYIQCGYDMAMRKAEAMKREIETTIHD